MISLTRQFAFIHINKAGGTSISEALAPWADAQTIVLDHDPAFLYRERMGAALWGEIFSFALLRNPWDRMVSSYEYRRQYLIGEGANAAACLSFRDWMLGPVTAAPLDKEWSNQLWMVKCPLTGEIMVSRLYLYEDILSAFDDACGRIGLDPVPELGRHNQTRRADYRPYYDAETDALVRDRFSDDLAWASEHHPARWVEP